MHIEDSLWAPRRDVLRNQRLVGQRYLRGILTSGSFRSRRRIFYGERIRYTLTSTEVLVLATARPSSRVFRTSGRCHGQTGGLASGFARATLYTRSVASAFP